MRFLLIAVCLCVYAEDIYISQSGAGTGASCVDSRSVTWFNTEANWGAGADKISAGDTAHLCGTLTSSLVALGSGTEGSPITILFETDAKISKAVCLNRNSYGCIKISNLSYIILDGGVNGIIEATDAGTGLGSSADGVGVVAFGVQHSEIRNLTIRNMYVRTDNSDYTDYTETSLGAAIYLAGNITGTLVHGNTISHCFWCINYQFNQSSSGVRIYGNDISYTDHAIAIGGYGGGTVTDLEIYGNHIHDYANWDAPDVRYHHDGIHVYASTTSGVDGIDIYNNVFSGDPGVSHTAHIYIETGGTGIINVRAFNNLILPAPPTRSTNFGLISFNSSDTPGNAIYNNTIIGSSKTAGNYGILAVDGSTVIKNNLITGVHSGIGFYRAEGCPNCTIDNNVYADSTCAGYHQSVCYNIANWRTLTSQDASSQSAADAGVSLATGLLSAGSPAIGAGANLSSLGITSLNSDKNGRVRPLLWSIGAYEYAPPTTHRNGIIRGRTIQ